jgi:hypothetical protein
MRRLGFGCLGAVAGHLVGWLIAVCWMASSGNLMMPADVYEVKRASILLTVGLIVGVSTVLAGLLAWCSIPVEKSAFLTANPAISTPLADKQ